MFEQRPVGLGTPNAMVGEGEFMALYTSPRVKLSKVKNTGDITVDGKAVELKGTELRFYSPMKITGKQVQTHAQTLAKKYEVIPNSTVGNRTAFEPWDHGKSKNAQSDCNLDKAEAMRQPGGTLGSRDVRWS